MPYEGISSGTSPSQEMRSIAYAIHTTLPRHRSAYLPGRLIVAGSHCSMPPAPLRRHGLKIMAEYYALQSMAPPCHFRANKAHFSSHRHDFSYVERSLLPSIIEPRLSLRPLRLRSTPSFPPPPKSGLVAASPSRPHCRRARARAGHY